MPQLEGEVLGLDFHQAVVARGRPVVGFLRAEKGDVGANEVGGEEGHGSLTVLVAVEDDERRTARSGGEVEGGVVGVVLDGAAYEVVGLDHDGVKVHEAEVAHVVDEPGGNEDVGVGGVGAARRGG